MTVGVSESRDWSNILIGYQLWPNISSVYSLNCGDFLTNISVRYRYIGISFLEYRLSISVNVRTDKILVVRHLLWSNIGKQLSAKFTDMSFLEMTLLYLNNRNEMKETGIVCDLCTTQEAFLAPWWVWVRTFHLRIPTESQKCLLGNSTILCVKSKLVVRWKDKYCAQMYHIAARSLNTVFFLINEQVPCISDYLIAHTQSFQMVVSYGKLPN